jgi:hypothetical protein
VLAEGEFVLDYVVQRPKESTPQKPCSIHLISSFIFDGPKTNRFGNY